MDLRETFEETNSSNTRSDHFFGVVVGVSLLLGLFVALSLGASLQKSPTADENFHLVAGYSYIRWGDYRINPEHPPFAKILATLPLLALEINDAALSRDQRDVVQANRMYGWFLANRWLFANNNAEKIFFYAKLPMILLGVSLGVLVFFWANKLYGTLAGFVALGLYSLDPNIIGHTPIVHTDIPLTLFSFAGTYFFWRLLKEVTCLNWLFSSLCLALAIITKFSGFALLFIWGLLAIVRIFSPEPTKVYRVNYSLLGHWKKTRYVAVVLLSSGVVVYTTIWAVYGFRYEAVSAQQGALIVGNFVQQPEFLESIVRLNAEHHLFPEAWWKGLHYAYSQTERSAYLLGKISDQGFWLYFPIAFAVKTPLPTIILLLVSLFASLSRDKHQRDQSFLLIPIFVFFSLLSFHE